MSPQSNGTGLRTNATRSSPPAATARQPPMANTRSGNTVYSPQQWPGSPSGRRPRPATPDDGPTVPFPRRGPGSCCSFGSAGPGRSRRSLRGSGWARAPRGRPAAPASPTSRGTRTAQSRSSWSGSRSRGGRRTWRTDAPNESRLSSPTRGKYLSFAAGEGRARRAAPRLLRARREVFQRRREKTGDPAWSGHRAGSRSDIVRLERD